jgi:hypothetical protein
VNAEGRVFYVDHTTRKTQWNAPEMPLPPGWEQRRDDRGRVFYVDHNTRTTAWVRPNANTAANAVTQREREAERSNNRAEVTVELPSGWEQRTHSDGRAFYVNHSLRKTQWERPVATAASTANVSAASQNLPSGWEARQTPDGRIFYVNHSTRTTQWNHPSSATPSAAAKSADVTAPQYVRDFEAKRNKFYEYCVIPTGQTCTLNLRRSNIFEDSYVEVMKKSAEDLHKRLDIKYAGEQGLDYGGLSRDWFFQLSKEIFNPYYCLFSYVSPENPTLQINPNSNVNPDHLSYFRFVGRIVGMAAYHRKVIDGFFIRPFYKKILGMKVTLDDVDMVDPERAQSMRWMLENSITGVLDDVTFSIEVPIFDAMTVIDLLPNGRNIEVTDENKQQYVELWTEYTFKKGTEEQFDAFLKGFTEVIKKESVLLFDPHELELLISGVTDLSVDDWRKHTAYRNGYSDKHNNIEMFWTIVGGFTKEQRARLLQFVTGTSNLPMGGFAELWGSNGKQPFTIDILKDKRNALPQSHTCFNRIDLPEYDDLNTMQARLILAIEECGGFGAQ